MGTDYAQTPETEREGLGALVDVLSLGEPFLLALWQSSGLSLTQARVLRSVQRGHTNPSSVAQGLGVPPSSLSRVLERLEQRGYITRRLDPDDRRRVVIALTPSGEGVLADTPRLAKTALGRAVRAMSEEERQALAVAARALVREARRTADDEIDVKGARHVGARD
jgi:DNA-binding MarR family transcriptional regulator